MSKKRKMKRKSCIDIETKIQIFVVLVGFIAMVWLFHSAYCDLGHCK